VFHPALMCGVAAVTWHYYRLECHCVGLFCAVFTELRTPCLRNRWHLLAVLACATRP
jgi:hypothetical protein